MKKWTLILIVVLSFVAVAGFTSRLFSRGEVTTSPANRQQTMASPLSQPEEDDLRKFLSLTLTSIKERVQPLSCLDAERVVEMNFADGIRSREGQDVEMRLDIRENSLIVYLDVMHTYVVFPRLHQLGLAPAKYDVFCEKSYAAKVDAQKQFPYWAKSKKNVRDDPRMTAIVDQINEEYPAPDYDKITREEVRTYRVPMLTTKAVQPYDAWNDEKRSLYERVLAVAREEALLHCQPDKPVQMTIPDFHIGDPDIYILLDAPATRRTVEWITFSRDVSSGKYSAAPAKNLGLADEIKPLIPLIRARKAKQVTVECPSK